MSQQTTTEVDLVGDEMALNVARTALFAALVGAFAYVSFPHPLSAGVPVTLQVLGVFLAGIFLGPLWGAVAMVLYLAAGAVGAPVFSGGAAGLGVLFSQTGGFLWSYPIAAAVVGVVVHGGLTLQDLDRTSLARLVGGMVAATIVIYAIGTFGFAFVNDVGVVRAFVLSSMPFVPFEALKIAAAVGIVRNDAIRAE